MSSFIRTNTGLSIFINGKTYTVQSEHHNYKDVVAAVKEKRWADVPDLINRSRAVQQYVDETSDEGSELTVDVEAGVVLFRGQPVRPILTQRILDMAGDGFDVNPMSRFLNNLLQNPSFKAIEQLYGWMEANGVTITEDGYLLAFKRVREDFLSLYDSKTKNFVGTYVEMPRNAVDDRSENTCSHGLHFCSQAYLPSYSGGQGQVLLLKINPMDVVSIPTDYNNAKGRACKYFVLDALTGDARQGVETRNVVPQPVVTADTNYNESDAFKMGYRAGYKDGRGKQAYGKSTNYTGLNDDTGQLVLQYDQGYAAGRDDGRTKKPNLYGGEQLKGEQAEPTKSIPVLGAVQEHRFERLRKIVAEQLGFHDDEPKLKSMFTNFVADLGADSLDIVELVMAVEDEFGIEISDEDADVCHTMGAAFELVNRLLDR